MADIEKLNKSKEYKNYKSIDAALSIVGQSLEQFTVQSVTTVHQKISQKLGVRQQCIRQCSRNIPDQNRWCQTCTAWKRELLKYLKNPRERLKWNKMKSWKWPLAPDDIREVFMPGDWNMKDVNFKDLSTVINVWKRCTEVSGRMVNGIDPLRKLRNEFAHKYSSTLKIADNEMQNKFIIVFNVLNHPDIQAAIPTFNDLLKTLQDLEKFGMETNVEKALSEIQSTLGRVLDEKQKKNKAREEIQRTNKAERRMQMTLFLLALIMILAAMYMFDSSNFSGVNEVSVRTNMSTDYIEEGCLSEEPHSSFSHKYVRMLGYLSHHRSFVGRQWLFESLEEHLQENSTKQGVILMADMGYGKTAVVAKIVCATPSDDSYNLRKRLIAYHICRFDSIITKRQFVFIRRLTSMIAQSIPMFSELLKYQYTSCIDNFDAETCEKDPYGCFEECLINPLRSLPAQIGKPKLIIIDALDECEQHVDDRINGINGIASLLKYKLHLFPKWFKFILTCRNVWYCRHLKSRINILNLDSGDKRNVNDIKTFISTKGFNNTVNDFNFEPSSFLLVLSILNSDASLGQIQSLNIFYEHQFKRYFDIKYKHAKDILEIICSTFQPIIETHLWNIVSNTTDINPEDFEVAMRHLAHFLKSIDNKVHIMHVSLREWLLDKENIDFKINLSVGHYLNALYLLKLLRDKREKIDVVKFVSHAAYANTFMKVNVLDNFYSLKPKDVIEMDKNKNDYPLHRLARQFDSAVAAKCLLKHFPETDRLDKYNVTPAFLAASFGNLGILKTLTEAGANIRFRTKSFEDVIHLNLAAQMSFEKFHWDYGILDIAAQNGHYNIVRFVLKDYKTLNYPVEKKNGMNLLPVHLACKLGHIEIVKYIYERRQRLDNVCLYYAAEGGHTGLVDYLLNIKIKDDCKLCGSNLHWIPKGMIRMQGQKIVSNFQRRYQNIYVLSDDWHFIACETALHIAVRQGYVEVVKALLNYPSIYSFNCTDRGGRTPLISAIQYNRTDIVKIFISKNLFRGNVKCVRPPSLSDIPQLHEKERTILKSYSCPNAFSAMHIIAKYNSVWVVDLLQKHNITPKWDIRDSEGCFPAHIAACHGSMEVLNYLLDMPKQRSEDYKCTDGTSLLETAAKCSSYASVSFLVGGTVNIDSYDLKKSVVFVALNRSKGFSFAVNNLDTESNISKIIQIFLKNQDDIMKKYERNRNILHISLLHGHHQVASDIFLKYSKAAIQLMRDKDLDTYTPLRLAISNLEKTTSFLFNFSSNTTMETSKCFLTNRDYTILISLGFVEKNSLLSEKERKLLLLELVQKNHIPLVSMYFRQVNKNILRDDKFIEQVLSIDSTYILTFDILFLKLLDLQHLLANKIMCNISCTKMITSCHSHTLALRFGQVSSAGLKLLGEYYSGIIDKIILNFFPENRDLLSSCYDDDGYNVLERAIQGGSQRLFQHLVKLGVKSKRSITDLILFAINPSYRSKTETYFILGKQNMDGSTFVKLIDKNHIREDISQATRLGYGAVTNLLLEFFKNYKFVSFQTIPRSYFDMDTIVSIIINKGHTSTKKNVFCSGHNAQKLSLVHIFAMHDMSLTLSNISHFWGSDVLNCRNVHSITPMYLANSLHQGRVSDLFTSMSFKKIYPKKSDEKDFIVHFLSRFLLKNYGNKDIFCIFRYYKKHMPRNIYAILKAFVCFSTFSKIIGERYKLAEDLSFIFSNYKLLVSREMCTSKGRKRLRGLMSGPRYLDLVRQANDHMINVINVFILKSINHLKGIDKTVLDNLKNSIEHIQTNPTGLLSRPYFCAYRKIENWGYLRNQFRFLIEYLKLKLMEENGIMIANTLFFSTRFNMDKAKSIAPYMRFLPSFRYIKEIDNLPFFEDTYLLFLKLASADGSWGFIDQTSNVLLYKQWNEEADRLKNEYLHGDDTYT